MDAENFIIALLNSTPDKTVKGKKRLQKLVFLLREAGADCAVTFRLKDFGPFSAEVEHSTSFLSLTGDLEEREEQIGYANYLASVYTLTSFARERAQKLPERLTEILVCLNRFTTVELEIASTIRYFEKLGVDKEKAIQSTRAMKPTKANEKVISKAQSILACLQ